jgi:cyclase
LLTLDDFVFVETAYQGSNNSIIRTSDGLVLIDAPLRPSDAVAWRKIVDSLGDTRYLINTDHHPDHTFGNAFLPGQVVGHRGTLELMKKDAALGAENPFLDLLRLIDPEGCVRHLAGYQRRVPAITFTDRMSLQIGDVEFELIHAPGHTLNTIAIHLPQQGIVFVGDAVCEAGIPSFVDADTYAWLDTINKIEALGAHHVITGHGEVCGPEILPVFRQELEVVIGEVERRVGLGQTREQVAAEVTYEDRIHTSVNGWTGYPQAVVDMIIRLSVERIYDDILKSSGSPRSPET